VTLKSSVPPCPESHFIIFRICLLVFQLSRVASHLEDARATKEADSRVDNEAHREGAHRLYGALSRRGLEPIKLAYNLMSAEWPAQINSQRLQPTSASMRAVLVARPTAMQAWTSSIDALY